MTDKKMTKKGVTLYDFDEEDAVETEVDAADHHKHPRKGFFAAIKSFWPRPETAPSVGPIEPMDGEEDHWVDLNLEQLLVHEPSALLHIVSLKAFSQAVGPAWERISTKAMMIAEGVLRQQGGPMTKIQQWGNDAFLVIFPHLTPEAGRRRAFDISVAIGKKLVGAKFQILGSGGALGIGLVSVPGRAVMGETGALTPERVHQAVEAAPQVSETMDAGVWLSTVGKAEVSGSLEAGGENSGPQMAEGWLSFKVKQQKPEIRLVPLEPPKHRNRNAEMEWVPIQREPRKH